MNREAVAAGVFYPAEASDLRACLQALLYEAKPDTGLVPSAVVAPHACYRFSGAVAAAAYRAWQGAAFDRVVVISVSHYAHQYGLMRSSATAFSTPLGCVPVDGEWLNPWPAILNDERAHQPEYGIEVQLPWLQQLLQPDWQLVPLLVGSTPSQADCEALVSLCLAALDEPRTALVISSDLSHYQPVAVTEQRNQRCAYELESLQPERLAPDSACGVVALQALLQALQARQGGMACVDLSHSAQGINASQVGADSVVGYGAFHGFVDCRAVSDTPRYLQRDAESPKADNRSLSVTQVKSALATQGYCLTRIDPCDEAAFQTVRDALGAPWQHESATLLIQPRDKPQFVGQGSGVIEAHNECAYAEQPPRYLVLYCVKQAVEGGQFALIDSREVLSALAPVWWPSLREARYRCQPSGPESANECHLLRQTPEGEALVYTAIGSESGRDSYYRVTHAVDDSTWLLLPRLNALLSDARYFQRHDWCAGDVLFIDNWRFLHRRDSFLGSDRVLKHYRIQ